MNSFLTIWTLGFARELSILISTWGTAFQKRHPFVEPDLRTSVRGWVWGDNRSLTGESLTNFSFSSIALWSSAVSRGVFIGIWHCEVKLWLLRVWGFKSSNAERKESRRILKWTEVRCRWRVKTWLYSVLQSFTSSFSNRISDDLTPRNHWRLSWIGHVTCDLWVLHLHHLATNPSAYTLEMSI